MFWRFILLATRLMIAMSISLLLTTICWADNLAIFYGNNLPVNELALYQRVVVQADQTSQAQLKHLQNYDVQVLAYLSLGEGHTQDVKTSFAKTLSKNYQWNSLVMDLSDEKWQRHVLTQAENLLAEGYAGFFLDTLDSYWLAEISPEEHIVQQQALAQLILKLKALGTKILIQNRGFELLETTHKAIDAVAAESLFAAYNVSKDEYHLIKESDTQWLTEQFRKVQDMGLEAIAIDYVKEHKNRAEIADKIQALGITAWVSDGHLTQLGTGNLRPIPRRVLVAYDSQQNIYAMSMGHQLFVPHLEYLGYLPQYIDISQEKWPQADPALYAGALFYLSGGQYTSSLLADLGLWQNRIPMLFLNDLPSNDAFLKGLGLKLIPQNREGEFTFHAKEPWSFEANINDLPNWMRPKFALENNDRNNQVLLSFESQNKRSALAVSGSWGGAVLQPALFLPLPESNLKWFYDPVKILRQGLKLNDIPIADLTTEHGRRIMSSHIDGDGFVSRAKFQGSPMAAEVMLKEIIEQYHLPITVSVIEGEVGPKGLYPKTSKAAEAIARQIFAKPYVEVASHSYSHPFYWGDVPDGAEAEYGYHLPIKNYSLSLEREVMGSIKYINENLTTPEKPVVLMLWTGDALPNSQAIAYTKKAGVLNVNGGNTKLIKGQSSLTKLWPIARPMPGGIQVYAPIMNENVYTELWQGAHFGYQRVLETYELTNKPRRYKPISIYYHFYSAEDPAGLKALKRIYDDVLKQDIFPMYLSDYARKADEFYKYGVAKTKEGEWFTKLNNITTLRVPKRMGLPILTEQNQFKGYKSYNDSVYLHVNQRDLRFSFTNKPIKQGYLLSSSASLREWTTRQTKTQTEVRFIADSFLPFELDYSHPGKCRLHVGELEYQSKKTKQKHAFKFKNVVTNQSMRIVCQ